MRLAYSLPLIALAGVAAAQTPTVIPSAAATTRPTLSPFYTANVFYSTTSATTAPASRSQTIVDCADIGTTVRVWKSLEIRRPVGLGNANPAITTTATVVLSISTSPWTASTTTFASNHGTNTTQVINTAINLPAATNPSTWPAPWQPAFPFSQPFVYTPATGGSFVLDVTQVQATGQTSWYLEYTTPDNGGRGENGGYQSKCLFSNGKANGAIGYTTGGLKPSGGAWYVNYQGLPPNLPGLATLSLYGVDNKGIWPLPIDLTFLGAPGCSWNVGLEMGLWVPLTSNASGIAQWPSITIPASAGGWAFYDHAFFLDPPANAAGIVSTWSSKWNIGTGVGAPSALVYATGNSYTNATGSRIAGGCPTFQLQ